MTETTDMARQIITGKANLVGVIGWPVAHSLSPALHNYWLRQYRIDGAYVPLPVAPTDFTAVLSALPKMGWRGVNLTIPHKEAALPLLDRVDPEALKIGAVNTVIFDCDGTATGYNTDAYGFIAHFSATMSGRKPVLESAMILGAGGAARAVIVALLNHGFKRLCLVNRTKGRAEALAKEFGSAIQVLDWDAAPAAMADVSLLVNSTSLGMQGQGRLDLDISTLPHEAVVYDLVYSPLETALLQSARARGLWTIDGLGMLLHQAARAFQFWFGIDPAVTPALRNYIMQARS